MSGKEWLESHGSDDTIREGNKQLTLDIYRNNTNQGNGNAQLDDVVWAVLDTIDYVGGMLFLDKDEETGQYVSLITKEPFTETEMAIVLGMDFVAALLNIVPGAGKASTTAVKKTVKNVVKNEVKNGVKGGRYSEVRKSNKGDEVHHLIPDSVSDIPRKDGPSILMSPEDHKKTASWGNSKAAKEYRNKQKDLVEQGKNRDALANGIKDVRSSSGSKYNTELMDAVKSTKNNNKFKK